VHLCCCYDVKLSFVNYIVYFVICYVWLYLPIHFVSGSSSILPEPDTFYCTQSGAEYADYWEVIECPGDYGDVPICPNDKPCIDLYDDGNYYYASQEGEKVCKVDIQEYKDDLDNGCWGSLRTRDSGIVFDR
jgi:hypothetical protein